MLWQTWLWNLRLEIINMDMFVQNFTPVSILSLKKDENTSDLNEIYSKKL